MTPESALGDDPGNATGRAVSHEDLAGLLILSARGDEGAFAQLYDLTAARISGVVRRIVRDPVHSDEVIQQVFMDIWLSSGRFDPTCSSASSWLMTIAHRLSVERARAVDPTRGRGNDSWPGSSDAVPLRSTGSAAADSVAMEALTPLQRQTIDLAYFGGYTHAEVARTMELPASTVQSHLRHGLIRLRATLQRTQGPVTGFGKPAGVA